MQGQRIKEMDYLRAIAAMAVIGIHVSTGYMSNKYSIFINEFCRFAVPLFIIISGFVLYSPDKRITTLSDCWVFYKKRLNKIFVPYIVWSFLYIIYKTLKANNGTFPPLGTLAKNTLMDLLYGGGFGHLYFIVIIIQLYLIYPILTLCIERFKKLTLSISFIISFGIQTGLYLATLKIVIMPRVPLGYNYAILGLTWIFFFAFGMYMKTAYTRFIEWSKGCRMIIWGLFWAASFLLFLYDLKKTKVLGSSMQPTVFIYTIATFLFFAPVLNMVRNSSNIALKFLKWFSDQSFIIYFVHSFVIFGIREVIPLVGLKNQMALTRGLFAMLVLTIGFSALLAWIVSLTPLAPALGGVRTLRGDKKISDRSA